MDSFAPLLFASIAAVGNAMFAFGQKQAVGVENGLLFVSACALIAFALSFLFAPLIGLSDFAALVKGNWLPALTSGVGLFLTYVGFNLLYSRYGASPYVIYASLSIITTTVIVGFWLLKEPLNAPRVVSIALALAAVISFSLGQSKP